MYDIAAAGADASKAPLDLIDPKWKGKIASSYPHDDDAVLYLGPATPPSSSRPGTRRPGSGQEAVRLGARLTPDVVLMDLRFAGPGQGIDGVEAARRLGARAPGVAVVMRSTRSRT